MYYLFNDNLIGSDECLCVCLFLCMYVCMYTCVCVCVYVYVSMYVYVCECTVRSESRFALRPRYGTFEACIDARGHHFQQIL
jgi:hypothetical protein